MPLHICTASAQQSQFNNNLFNYGLDELMPWHKEDGLRDFSVLEVNRYFISNHFMKSYNPNMHTEISVKLEGSVGKL